MAIDYNKTIGLPILVIKDGKEVGSVREFVVDFDNGLILGLLLSAGILERNRVIKIRDVKEFGKDSIMIEDEKVIMPLRMIGVFRDLLKKKIKIKGNRVVTESGEELGEVKNYEVDDISYKISKIFVSEGVLKDLFKGELIVRADNIVSIGKDAIIVRDNVVKEKDEAVVSKIESQEAAVDVLGVTDIHRFKTDENR